MKSFGSIFLTIFQFAAVDGCGLLPVSTLAQFLLQHDDDNGNSEKRTIGWYRTRIFAAGGTYKGDPFTYYSDFLLLIQESCCTA